jgi:PA domain
MHRIKRLLFQLWVGGLLATSLSAAEFIFVNADGANEGLNDPATVTAVGGNTATTRGAQRLAALRRVGEIWGRYLVSAVPIRVSVNFDPLAAGVLAQAAAVSLQENFTKAPKANCWYPVALANSLAGRDLEPLENDITITANSNGTFYYGLDSASPGELSNFVDILLHELAHGLGFSSYSDDVTGAFYTSHPDIFSTLMYDLQLDRPWINITASQRVSSSISEPYLVWNGPYTTAGLKANLTKQSGASGFSLSTTIGNAAPQLTRFAPSVFNPAQFSSVISGALVLTSTGQSSPADPLGACIPLTNAAAVAGKIALIRRGICDFDTKVYNAQQAGAIAAIIVNNVSSPSVLTPGGDSSVDGQRVTITIPSVMVSKLDGDRLIAAAPSGARATFKPLDNDYAGTTGNRLQLYAPAPLELGSSVSHWSTSASPDLLMEPFINPNLDRELDLSLTQMKDIGWQVLDIPFPDLTYETWKATVFSTTDTLTQLADDSDHDGVSNLEEYFFGNSPISPDAGKLPTFRLTQGLKQFIFTRSKLPSDLSYRLEKSTDLASFSAATEGVDYVVAASVSLSSSAEQVTLTSLSSAATQFMRLRVTSP